MGVSINNVGLQCLNINFKQLKDNNSVNIDSRILLNTLSTRTSQTTQKVMSAFLDYPIKGLKGDINTNFYEFLTMGIIPSLLGSLMFMLTFNVLNIGKYLGERDSVKAGNFGKKMALGVLMYAIFKNLSKHLVTKPVKLATGIDIEMPYQNKVVNLPKNADENANLVTVLQQRKVFDSKEFFRKDLLTREFYDNVAKTLNMGTDLNDSISETTPIIQNVVATTNTAKTLSSYSWAAVGVGLAMQDTWLDFFDVLFNKNNVKGLGKRIPKISKQLCISIVESFKQLYSGKESQGVISKYSGKALLGFAILTTTTLTANVIKRAKNMSKNSNLRTIDSSKEITVI